MQARLLEKQQTATKTLPGPCSNAGPAATALHCCRATIPLVVVTPPGTCPQEFNRGIFDYLIATDDVAAAAAKGRRPRPEAGDEAAAASGAPMAAAAGAAGKGGKKRKAAVAAGGKDQEFGITRYPQLTRETFSRES